MEIVSESERASERKGREREREENRPQKEGVRVPDVLESASSSGCRQRKTATFLRSQIPVVIGYFGSLKREKGR